MSLRIHAFEAYSRANGPGLRAVIWVQGCSLGCSGCFNPHTHPFEGGERVSVGDLFRRIVALGDADSAVDDAIEGVTLSGGEPLQQPRPVLALLRKLRTETSLSTLLFTGFTWAEVQAMPQAPALLDCLDVLVTGRYDAAQPLGRGLRGSANQTLHRLSDRYGLAELDGVPEGEVTIGPDGRVTLSGVDPLAW